MWSDNEASQDFLNFQMVAETAAEMIIQSSGTPLSLDMTARAYYGPTALDWLTQRERLEMGER